VIMALGASRSQDDDSRAPSMSDQIGRHKQARFARLHREDRLMDKKRPPHSLGRPFSLSAR
jgi:hypothetical protein